MWHRNATVHKSSCTTFVANKTHVLMFGMRKVEVPTLANVEQAEHAKFIGIVVNSNLSSTNHVDFLTINYTPLYFSTREYTISAIPTMPR